MKRIVNKILIRLYVPVIDECYDIRIPLDKKLYKVIYLLIKSIYDLSEGAYIPQSSPHLYDKWSAHCFDIDLTVKENNIQNGAELILI